MSESNEILRKQSIKDAARSLFLHFGYTKTSMEDIAHLCGLAKPTLYYYYANKEAIFEDIVTEEAVLVIDSAKAHIRSDLPSDEKIVLFTRHIYYAFKRYASEMEETPTHFPASSPHGQPIILKIRQLFRKELQQLLKTGKQNGILQYQNDEATLDTLMLMGAFINLDLLRRYPEKKCDAIIETALKIVLNGIVKRSK